MEQNMEGVRQHALLLLRSALASRQHGTFFSVRLIKYTSQSTKPRCRPPFYRSATGSTMNEQNFTAHPRAVQESLPLLIAGSDYQFQDLSAT
jgi:hypothetical protein